MTMTYATITGLITRPGSDIGIRARIRAIPMTAGGILAFPSESRITWGPEIATTASDGSLSMEIPTGHGLTDLYWRFIAEPLDTTPGISTWTLGTFQITADASLDDLVDVDLVAVTPDLEERIAALVADAEAAALVWQPSTAVTTGATRQAPDGSRIKSTASRTTRSSFDATEKTFWKSVLGTPGTIESDDLTASIAQVKNWAKNPDALITGSITYDDDGVIETAAVVWPDGTTGTFTTDTVGSTFLTVDGYHITYVGTTTKTYTQPTITRDASGAATSIPAIVVT